MIDLLFICLIVLILYSALMIIFWKPRKRKSHLILNNDDLLAFDLTRDELSKTLNFMLMYGVIDIDEYNKMNLKGLPYTRG